MLTGGLCPCVLQQVIDWGLAVLDCFKAQVTSSPSVSPIDKSYEFAIVSIIRAVSRAQNLFRSYMMQSADGKRDDAVQGMQKIISDILPASVDSLQHTYNSSKDFTADVLLQTQALLSDMLWFAREGSFLINADPSRANQVFESMLLFTADHMRHTLRWLFHVQFGGPTQHVPAAVPSTPFGCAVLSATSSVGAVYLPSQSVATSDLEWQQVQSMLGDALNLAAAASFVSKAAMNGTAVYAAAVSALARSHVQDFWSRRLQGATAAASPAVRSAAMDDRSFQRSWKDVVVAQMELLLGLLQQAEHAQWGVGVYDATWPDQIIVRMSAAKNRLITATAQCINPDLPVGGPNVDLLGKAYQLANMTQLCYSDKQQSACTDLKTETMALLATAQGLTSNDLLYPSLKASLVTQWRCTALGADKCGSDPACAKSVLPPAVAAGSDGSSPSVPVIVCEAAASEFGLQAADNATKASMSTSSSCADFLQLPACETFSSAAMCKSAAACQWLPGMTNTRWGGAGGNLSGAATGKKGDCAMNWATVLAQVGPWLIGLRQVAVLHGLCSASDTIQSNLSLQSAALSSVCQAYRLHACVVACRWLQCEDFPATSSVYADQLCFAYILKQLLPCADAWQYKRPAVQHGRHLFSPVRCCSVCC